MEPITIAQEIHDSAKRLSQGSGKLFEFAKAKAETERAYRRALQLTIMQLRENKVQATLIPDVARGMTADLKFERDLADAKYTSARDALDAIKSQINGLQTVIKFMREVQDEDN